MSLRKERFHRTGMSNIDFRSKRDKDAIDFYQPWTTANQYGTMGNANCSRPFSDHKKVFGVTALINTQKYIASDIPDPRFYKSAKYYKANKLSMLKRNIFTSDRVGQLDETYKGKERYTGDSMMIADITKQRRRKKLKFTFEDHEHKQKQIRGQIIKDKGNKNKEAIQETQLVKVEVPNTLDGIVDIKKVKEIRLALRRRYANRSNFRKIFKDWDISSQGEISIYDAHLMINKLSIPINYNETRVLIASANHRGTESLNMEEFMHLIFNDNNALNVDLTKMEYKDEDLYNEMQQEGLKVTMVNNIREMSKTQDINYFKEFIRVRLPQFVKYVSECGGENGLCDYNTFMKVVDRFQLGTKLRKEPVLRAFYDMFTNENDLLDLNKVSDNVLEHTNKTYFSEKKDEILSQAKDDINRRETELTETLNNNVDGHVYNKQKAKDLQIQLEHKYEMKQQQQKEEMKYLTEVNNSVPSTAFVNKMFDKRKEHYNTLNDVESKFDSMCMIKENQRKTRFGANPTFRDTGVTTMYGDNCYGNYNVNEIERFKHKADSVDIANEDKDNRMKLRNSIIERKRKVLDNVRTNYYWRDYLIEEKDKYTQLQMAKLKYGYEDKFRIRNKIVE